MSLITDLMKKASKSVIGGVEDKISKGISDAKSKVHEATEWIMHPYRKIAGIIVNTFMNLVMSSLSQGGLQDIQGLLKNLGRRKKTKNRQEEDKLKKARDKAKKLKKKLERFKKTSKVVQKVVQFITKILPPILQGLLYIGLAVIIIIFLYLIFNALSNLFSFSYGFDKTAYYDSELFTAVKNKELMEENLYEKASETSYYQRFVDAIGTEELDVLTSAMLPDYLLDDSAMAINSKTKEEMAKANYTGFYTMDSRVTIHDANMGSLRDYIQANTIDTDLPASSLAQGYLRDYFGKESNFELSDHFLMELNNGAFASYGEDGEELKLVYPETFTKPLAFTYDYNRMNLYAESDGYYWSTDAYVTKRIQNDDIGKTYGDLAFDASEKEWGQYYNNITIPSDSTIIQAEDEGEVYSIPSPIVWEYVVKEKDAYNIFDINADGSTNVKEVENKYDSKYLTLWNLETNSEEIVKFYYLVKSSTSDFGVGENGHIAVEETPYLTLNPMGKGSTLKGSNVSAYLSNQVVTKTINNVECYVITIPSGYCRVEDKNELTDQGGQEIYVRKSFNPAPTKHLQLSSLVDENENVIVPSQNLINYKYYKIKTVNESYRNTEDYISGWADFILSDETSEFMTQMADTNMFAALGTRMKTFNSYLMGQTVSDDTEISSMDAEAQTGFIDLVANYPEHVLNLSLYLYERQLCGIDTAYKAPNSNDWVNVNNDSDIQEDANTDKNDTSKWDYVYSLNAYFSTDNKNLDNKEYYEKFYYIAEELALEHDYGIGATSGNGAAIELSNFVSDLNDDDSILFAGYSPRDIAYINLENMLYDQMVDKGDVTLEDFEDVASANPIVLLLNYISNSMSTSYVNLGVMASEENNITHFSDFYGLQRDGEFNIVSSLKDDKLHDKVLDYAGIRNQGGSVSSPKVAPDTNNKNLEFTFKSWTNVVGDWAHNTWVDIKGFFGFDGEKTDSSSSYRVSLDSDEHNHFQYDYVIKDSNLSSHSSNVWSEYMYRKALVDPSITLDDTNDLPMELRSVRDYGLGSVLNYVDSVVVRFKSGVYYDEYYLGDDITNTILSEYSDAYRKVAVDNYASTGGMAYDKTTAPGSIIESSSGEAKALYDMVYSGYFPKEYRDLGSDKLVELFIQNGKKQFLYYLAENVNNQIAAMSDAYYDASNDPTKEIIYKQASGDYYSEVKLNLSSLGRGASGVDHVTDVVAPTNASKYGFYDNQEDQAVVFPILKSEGSLTEKKGGFKIHINENDVAKMNEHEIPTYGEEFGYFTPYLPNVDATPQAQLFFPIRYYRTWLKVVQNEDENATDKDKIEILKKFIKQYILNEDSSLVTSVAMPEKKEALSHNYEGLDYYYYGANYGKTWEMANANEQLIKIEEDLSEQDSDKSFSGLNDYIYYLCTKPTYSSKHFENAYGDIPLISDGNLKKVYLIDEAITFTGKFMYTYKDKLVCLDTIDKGDISKGIIGSYATDRYVFLDSWDVKLLTDKVIDMSVMFFKTNCLVLVEKEEFDCEGKEDYGKKKTVYKIPSEETIKNVFYAMASATSTNESVEDKWRLRVGQEDSWFSYSGKQYALVSLPEYAYNYSIYQENANGEAQGLLKGVISWLYENFFGNVANLYYRADDASKHRIGKIGNGLFADNVGYDDVESCYALFIPSSYIDSVTKKINSADTDKIHKMFKNGQTGVLAHNRSKNDATKNPHSVEISYWPSGSESAKVLEECMEYTKYMAESFLLTDNNSKNTKEHFKIQNISQQDGQNYVEIIEDKTVFQKDRGDLTNQDFFNDASLSYMYENIESGTCYGLWYINSWRKLINEYGDTPIVKSVTDNAYSEIIQRATGEKDEDNKPIMEDVTVHRVSRTENDITLRQLLSGNTMFRTLREDGSNFDKGIKLTTTVTNTKGKSVASDWRADYNGSGIRKSGDGNLDILADTYSAVLESLGENLTASDIFKPYTGNENIQNIPIGIKAGVNANALVKNCLSGEGYNFYDVFYNTPQSKAIIDELLDGSDQSNGVNGWLEKVCEWNSGKISEAGSMSSVQIDELVGAEEAKNAIIYEIKRAMDVAIFMGFCVDENGNSIVGSPITNTTTMKPIEDSKGLLGGDALVNAYSPSNILYSILAEGEQGLGNTYCGTVEGNLATSYQISTDDDGNQSSPLDSTEDDSQTNTGFSRGFEDDSRAYFIYSNNVDSIFGSMDDSFNVPNPSEVFSGCNWMFGGNNYDVYLTSQEESKNVLANWTNGKSGTYLVDNPTWQFWKENDIKPSKFIQTYSTFRKVTTDKPIGDIIWNKFTEIVEAIKEWLSELNERYVNKVDITSSFYMQALKITNTDWFFNTYDWDTLYKASISKANAGNSEINELRNIFNDYVLVLDVWKSNNSWDDFVYYDFKTFNQDNVANLHTGTCVIQCVTYNYTLKVSDEMALNIDDGRYYSHVSANAKYESGEMEYLEENRPKEDDVSNAIEDTLALRDLTTTGNREYGELYNIQANALVSQQLLDTYNKYVSSSNKLTMKEWKQMFTPETKVFDSINEINYKESQMKEFLYGTYSSSNIETIDLPSPINKPENSTYKNIFTVKNGKHLLNDNSALKTEYAGDFTKTTSNGEKHFLLVSKDAYTYDFYEYLFNIGDLKASFSCLDGNGKISDGKKATLLKGYGLQEPIYQDLCRLWPIADWGTEDRAFQNKDKDSIADLASGLKPMVSFADNTKTWNSKGNASGSKTFDAKAFTNALNDIYWDKLFNESNGLVWDQYGANESMIKAYKDYFGITGFVLVPRVADRRDEPTTFPLYRYYIASNKEIAPEQVETYFEGQTYDSWTNRMSIGDDNTDEEKEFYNKEKKRMSKYLYSYLQNFEAYIPYNIISDSDLEIRGTAGYGDLMTNEKNTPKYTKKYTQYFVNEASKDYWTKYRESYNLTRTDLAQLLQGIAEVSLENSGERALFILRHYNASNSNRIIAHGNDNESTIPDYTEENIEILQKAIIQTAMGTSRDFTVTLDDGNNYLIPIAGICGIDDIKEYEGEISQNNNDETTIKYSYEGDYFLGRFDDSFKSSIPEALYSYKDEATGTEYQFAKADMSAKDLYNSCKSAILNIPSTYEGKFVLTFDDSDTQYARLIIALLSQKHPNNEIDVILYPGPDEDVHNLNRRTLKALEGDAAFKNYHFFDLDDELNFGYTEAYAEDGPDVAPRSTSSTPPTGDEIARALKKQAYGNAYGKTVVVSTSPVKSLKDMPPKSNYINSYATDLEIHKNALDDRLNINKSISYMGLRLYKRVSKAGDLAKGLYTYFYGTSYINALNSVTADTAKNLVLYPEHGLFYNPTEQDIEHALSKLTDNIDSNELDTYSYLSQDSLKECGSLRKRFSVDNVKRVLSFIDNPDARKSIATNATKSTKTSVAFSIDGQLPAINVENPLACDDKPEIPVEAGEEKGFTYMDGYRYNIPGVGDHVGQGESDPNNKDWTDIQISTSKKTVTNAITSAGQILFGSSTKQYSIASMASVSEEGILYIEEDGVRYYLCALGSRFFSDANQVGGKYVITTRDGNSWYAMTCDQKADRHTDKFNVYTAITYSDEAGGSGHNDDHTCDYSYYAASHGWNLCACEFEVDARVYKGTPEWAQGDIISIVPVQLADGEGSSTYGASSNKRSYIDEIWKEDYMKYQNSGVQEYVGHMTEKDITNLIGSTAIYRNENKEVDEYGYTLLDFFNSKEEAESDKVEFSGSLQTNLLRNAMTYLGAHYSQGTGYAGKWWRYIAPNGYIYDRHNLAENLGKQKSTPVTTVGPGKYIEDTYRVAYFPAKGVSEVLDANGGKGDIDGKVRSDEKDYEGLKYAFDCSSFGTQMYLAMGYDISKGTSDTCAGIRSKASSFGLGNIGNVSSFDQLKPGDLIISSTHTMIYMGTYFANLDGWFDEKDLKVVSGKDVWYLGTDALQYANSKVAGEYAIIHCGGSGLEGNLSCVNINTATQNTITGNDARIFRVFDETICDYRNPDEYNYFYLNGKLMCPTIFTSTTIKNNPYLVPYIENSQGAPSIKTIEEYIKQGYFTADDVKTAKKKIEAYEDMENEIDTETDYMK